MKKINLLFNGIALVVFAIGLSQLIRFIPSKDEMNYAATETAQQAPLPDQQNKSKKGLPSKKKGTTAARKQKVKPEKTAALLLPGQWIVDYDNAVFKSTIVYEIKKEAEQFIAYTAFYQDENGYSVKAEGNKSLIIHSFDGQKGKGIYLLIHEGQQYEVPCEISRQDQKSFQLSYDYYGYSDVEDWNRYKEQRPKK